MTFTSVNSHYNSSEVLEEILQRRKSRERTKKLKALFKTIGRIIQALCFIVCVSLIAAIPGTFYFHINNGNFAYNIWFFFCKLFFPMLPVVMWNLYRK